jgi:hypothetical protein
MVLKNTILFILTKALLQIDSGTFLKTLSITTLYLTTFSIMRLSIKGLFVTLNISDTQHKWDSALICSAIMLNVIMLSVAFYYHHAECHYDKCRCAECRSAFLNCNTLSVTNNVLKTCYSVKTKHIKALVSRQDQPRQKLFSERSSLFYKSII